MSQETDPTIKSRSHVDTPSASEMRRMVVDKPVEGRLDREKNPNKRRTGILAIATGGLAVVIGGGLLTMNALSDSPKAEEVPQNPGVEAPVVPGPDVDNGGEVEAPVGNLEFRESDLTPDVLASLSDAEIISRMQISVADNPTVEDWAEEYSLRGNDILRAGTSPSEITLLYDQGIDAMDANIDRYADLFSEALRANPADHKTGDILRLAVTNASQANRNGETYIIREDLESVTLTDGSVEEGTFSADLTIRRQDNMGDLEVTKNEIFNNTGNKLQTMSTDVDVKIKATVTNVDGFWKTTDTQVLSSTAHTE